jgi:hypothetical protein
MPQIAVVPAKHWNFRAIPARIDIERILQEAVDAGESVVRVRAKFMDGTRSYLFVQADSDDAKALLAIPEPARFRTMACTNGTDLKYTPYGFSFNTDAKECKWIVTGRVDIIEQALKLIQRQRELLKRRQRVTVECL